MKNTRLILILLILWGTNCLHAQDARSSRVGFMLNNVPDSIPPTITVTSPVLDGNNAYLSSRKLIVVSGKVMDDEEVKFIAINSIKHPIGRNGAFTFNLELFPGKNEIRLVAADIKNNLQERFIVIEYRTPGIHATESQEGG